MNYKLQLYTEDQDGEASFLTFYLDVDSIIGFYAPVLEEGELPSINVFVGTTFITILQEDHIIKYLNDKFSSGLIK